MAEEQRSCLPSLSLCPQCLAQHLEFTVCQLIVCVIQQPYTPKCVDISVLCKPPYLGCSVQAFDNQLYL